jgi:3-hydroxybutyryl-CoA dehydrogenase
MAVNVQREGDLRVAIIGPGTIGASLALVCSLYGHATKLYGRKGCSFDRARALIASGFEELLGAGLLPEGHKDWRQHLIVSDDDVEPETDLVIETVNEDLALKQMVFAQLEPRLQQGAILASSTSALPVDAIAVSCVNRTRIAVAHFANPPHLMPTVELVPGTVTSKDTMQVLNDFIESLGKTPVRLERDLPGHLFNRIQFAMLREAVSLVAMGVATPEQVDSVVKNGIALRLAEEGPLEKIDLAGVELVHSVASFLYPHLDHSTTPDFLEHLLRTGRSGAASGEGFYHWTPNRVRGALNRRNSEIIRHLKRRRGP